jgi:hypothetical protein
MLGISLRRLFVDEKLLLGVDDVKKVDDITSGITKWLFEFKWGFDSAGAISSGRLNVNLAEVFSPFILDEKEPVLGLGVTTSGSEKEKEEAVLRTGDNKIVSAVFEDDFDKAPLLLP